MWAKMQRVLSAAALVLLLVSSGSAGSRPAVGMVKAAGYRINFGTWTDWKGQIEVKGWMCDWEGPADVVSALCSTDPGYVVVGGGGEVEGAAPGGGLLTGSGPLDVQTWQVLSKAHMFSYPHRLRAYVLGMRMRDRSGNWMNPFLWFQTDDMYWVHATSCDGCPNGGALSHPVSTAFLANSPDYQPGDILIGGGAFARDTGAVGTWWAGAGQLLWESMPSPWPSSPGWYGGSKDHAVSDPGWVDTVAIGMHRCPSFFNGCIEGGSWNWNMFGNWSGYKCNSMSMDPNSSWVMTSVGAADDWSGAGRLLTDIIPTTGANGTGGVLAYSKDHGIVDTSGNLHVHMVGIRTAP
jgi:hypothetical protein